MAWHDEKVGHGGRACQTPVPTQSTDNGDKGSSRGATERLTSDTQRIVGALGTEEVIEEWVVSLSNPTGVVLGEEQSRGAVIIVGLDNSENASYPHAAAALRVGDRVLRVEVTEGEAVGSRETPCTFDDAVRVIRNHHRGSDIRLFMRRKLVRSETGEDDERTTKEQLSRDAWGLKTSSPLKFRPQEERLSHLVEEWRAGGEGKWEKLETEVCNQLRNYGRSRECRQLNKTMSMLMEWTLPFSSKLANNAMIAYIDAGEPEKASLLFEKCRNLTQGSVECWTTLIKSHARMNDLDAAFSVLKEMRACGLNPNDHTYNALIAACVSCRRLRRARLLFGEMLYDGVEPNVISWNIILNWHATIGRGSKRYEATLAALEDMVASGVQPNLISFTTLAKSCLVGGNMKQAENVISRMKEHGITPDTALLNQMIKGYGSVLRWRPALEIFDELRKTSKADATSHSLVIEACARAGQIERAEALLVAMIEAGFEPRGPTYMAILRAHSHQGEFQKAYSLLREMKSRSFPIDARSMATLMHSAVEAREEKLAISIFENMRRSGTPTDTVTLTLLAKAYGQSGDLNRAYRILNSMRKKSPRRQPSIITFNHVIASAVEHGHPSLALKTLRLLLHHGQANQRVSPDRNTFKSLTLACVVGNRGHNHLQFLMDAIRTLREFGYRPDGQMYASLLHTCLQAGENDLGNMIVNEQRKESNSFQVAARDWSLVNDLERMTLTTSNAAE
eukprot:CAMPEP_0184679748 /NCGR_PEP_ID=MMETSP0312-20130426/2606_1 /TAXON_ID=31354 /ORGANISM="Compsopogon coeruleus, Strain SAG 36.94" /LENGTH=734 /DNA_ID=CAMNT_0027129397 /DNA_START=443 /DNA_END=2648 /DNA_ORIENTATION=-